MSFSGLQKLVSYLFAALGLWAVSLGPHLPTASLVFAVIATVASLFAEGARIHRRRWIRGWDAALVTLLLVQIVRGFAGASLLSLGLEFTVALQVSRLFNRRGAAEYQQIAALALLMLIAATVLSTELAYAAAFAGFVVVTPWALALGHLRAEIEAHRGAGSDGRAARVRKVLKSRQLIGPRYLLGTAALSVPLFLMTGALFLVFPRVGLGMFSFSQTAGQTVTGFGADVELGAHGTIRSDSTVVLRVTPPDLPDAPQTRASIRMRGTSFDHYDGRRWTRSAGLDAVGVGRVGAYYQLPLRLPNAHDRRWSIVLDPLQEPVVFLPPRAVSLRIPPRVVGGVEVGREITRSPGLDVRYGDADGVGLRYDVFTARDAVLDPRLEPEAARRYLQVPAGHERVAELARRWAGSARTVPAQIRAIEAHLRDSGEFAYSLEMPEVGERAPLDVFLFDARRGHCEYYSTAMVIMLRTLGVPARNATGFLGGRFNPFGRYYALAQGDAHSWVEAWVQGHGWITLDPTPPARDGMGPDRGVFGALSELIDAVRTRWTADVVSYDLSRQIELFVQLRGLLGAGETQAARGERPTGSPPGDRGLGGWTIAAASLLLVVLGLLAWRLWLRRAPRRGERGGEHQARAVRLFTALDDALKRRGLPRPAHRTAAEHVERLEGGGFPEMKLVRQVVDRYLSVRYGGAHLTASELDRLLPAIRALGRARRPSRAQDARAEDS